MKQSDKTSIGGVKSTFEKTDWSEIQNAKTPDKTQRRVIIDGLTRKYWKPVYCYLRHKGYANEPAKDLTQAFFHEVVLGRELIQQADKAKGRFRTFLLTALDHYLTDVYRWTKATKRTPEGGIVQLGIDEFPNVPAAESETRPEQAFYYAWATDLLDEVLSEVKDECHNTGKRLHWQVFCAKILDPIAQNVEAPLLRDICRKYGIDSERKASNMIITVKRRFRAALERCLRQVVQSESEVEDELNELFEILSGSSAV